MRIPGYGGSSDFLDKDKINKYPAVKDGWLSKVYENGVLHYNSDRPNMKATQYLLDSTNEKWAGIKNSSNEKYIKWIVGTPTLEMLVAAYKFRDDATDIQFSDLTDSVTGYDIPVISNVYHYSGSPISHNDGTNSYWFATPTNVGTDGLSIWANKQEVMGWHMKTRPGQINSDNHLRPVVCLKSSVALTWNQETGVYDLNLGE